MKILSKYNEDIFVMANLNPQKSGVPVIIWSDHSACYPFFHSAFSFVKSWGLSGNRQFYSVFWEAVKEIENSNS